MKNTTKDVTRGAAWMAAGTLASRILGLVRETLIVAFLPRMVTDAFFVALRLPNLFRRLLGEGSLSVSFIPAFVQSLTNQGEKEAKELAAGVFTLLMVVVSCLTVAGIVWMEPLLMAMLRGEGYLAIPGKFALTVELGRIMFGFIFLMSLYAFFMAILQSFRIFGLPAVAPALFNVSLIIFLLLPDDWFDFQGEALAWGVIVGGGLQAGLLIPKLLRLGFFPRLTRSFLNPAVKKVLWAAVPSMAGMGILQLTGVLNIYFASRLPQGSFSFIYLADRILEFPLSLFAVSVGSSLLPTLSQFWAKGEKDKMLEATSSSLRLIFFISIPSALGMWLLALPITEVIFMHGKFSAAEAVVTSKVLMLYAITLLTASTVRILIPNFYAMKNTWLPALASVFGLIVHACFAIPLMDRWGLQGLVLSTIIGAICNLSVVVVSFRFWMGALPFRGLVTLLPKVFVCSVPLILIVQVYEPLFLTMSSAIESSLLLKAVRTFCLLFTIGLACAFYLGTSKFLKVTEFQDLMAAVRRRRK